MKRLNVLNWSMLLLAATMFIACESKEEESEWKDFDPTGTWWCTEVVRASGEHLYWTSDNIVFVMVFAKDGKYYDFQSGSLIRSGRWDNIDFSKGTFTAGDAVITLLSPAKFKADDVDAGGKYTAYWEYHSSSTTLPGDVETPGVPETEAEIRALLTAHPWKHVSLTTHYPQSPQDDRVSTTAYTVQFNANGTATQQGSSGSIPYTVSGNTLTMTYQGDYGPYPRAYTITKLTDTNLEFLGEFQGQNQSKTVDENGKEIDGPITYYTYTETEIFVKP